jgi:hypothetical protein
MKSVVSVAQPRIEDNLSDKSVSGSKRKRSDAEDMDKAFLAGVKTKLNRRRSLDSKTNEGDDDITAYADSLLEGNARLNFAKVSNTISSSIEMSLTASARHKLENVKRRKSTDTLEEKPLEYLLFAQEQLRKKILEEGSGTSDECSTNKDESGHFVRDKPREESVGPAAPRVLPVSSSRPEENPKENKTVPKPSTAAPRQGNCDKQSAISEEEIALLTKMVCKSASGQSTSAAKLPADNTCDSSSKGTGPKQSNIPPNKGGLPTGVAAPKPVAEKSAVASQPVRHAKRGHVGRDWSLLLAKHRPVVRRQANYFYGDMMTSTTAPDNTVPTGASPLSVKLSGAASSSVLRESASSGPPTESSSRPSPTVQAAKEPTAFTAVTKDANDKFRMATAHQSSQAKTDVKDVCVTLNKDASFVPTTLKRTPDVPGKVPDLPKIKETFDLPKTTHQDGTKTALSTSGVPKTTHQDGAKTALSTSGVHKTTHQDSTKTALSTSGVPKTTHQDGTKTALSAPQDTTALFRTQKQPVSGSQVSAGQLPPTTCDASLVKPQITSTASVAAPSPASSVKPPASTPQPPASQQSQTSPVVSSPTVAPRRPPTMALPIRPGFTPSVLAKKLHVNSKPKSDVPVLLVTKTVSKDKQVVVMTEAMTNPTQSVPFVATAKADVATRPSSGSWLNTFQQAASASEHNLQATQSVGNESSKNPAEKAGESSKQSAGKAAASQPPSKQAADPPKLTSEDTAKKPVGKVEESSKMHAETSKHMSAKPEASIKQIAKKEEVSAKEAKKVEEVSAKEARTTVEPSKQQEKKAHALPACMPTISPTRPATTFGNVVSASKTPVQTAQPKTAPQKPATAPPSLPACMPVLSPHKPPAFAPSKEFPSDSVYFWVTETFPGCDPCSVKPFLEKNVTLCSPASELSNKMKKNMTFRIRKFLETSRAARQQVSVKTQEERNETVCTAGAPPAQTAAAAGTTTPTVKAGSDATSKPEAPAHGPSTSHQPPQPASSRGPTPSTSVAGNAPSPAPVPVKQLPLDQFSVDLIDLELRLVEGCLKLLLATQEHPNVNQDTQSMIRLSSLANSKTLINALEFVVMDIKQGLEDTRRQFHGRANQRVPNELLMTEEMSSRYNKDGVYLYLQQAISLKPYNKLKKLKQDMQASLNRCGVLVRQNDTNGLMMERRRLMTLRETRNPLLRTFTGACNHGRLKKLQLSRDYYGACQSHILTVLGLENVKKMVYFRASFDAIKHHLAILEEELVSGLSCFILITYARLSQSMAFINGKHMITWYI